MNTPVVVSGLSFRYPGAPGWTLRDVSLQVEAGETVLLLGPSGAGKSTLALCLDGLIPHLIEGEMGGEVRIWGTPTVALPHARLCQQVGLVFQDPETQMVMPRVDEEVAFGLENLAVPPAEMPQRIHVALAQVGLLERRRAWVSALSGGQKQRLALAAVLALNTSILVLDEPTANLDPAGAAAFFQLLRQLRAERSLPSVLIEHRLDAALPLADQVVVIDNEGRLMASGTPRQVFAGQGAELHTQGIWLPSTCRLALALADAGRPLPGCPLSPAEAKLMLAPMLAAVPPQKEESPASATPPVNTQAAIMVEGLRFAYPDSPPALRGVDLQIGQGAFCALVGANGSGKTTLARHLIGLLRPTSGRVSILGQDTRRLRPQQLAQQVGYVFQNPEHQFVSERVADELAYSLRGRWGEIETRRRVERLLYTFGLEGYADANPFALSQGQKRRLSVATVVALEQSLLVLDEPTFGQDQHNAASLMALLQDLHANGVTILFITHDMELVADYATETAVMHEGQILFHGPTRALFRRSELLRQAALNVPPMAELGQGLGHPELLTVADWVKRLAFSGQVARRGQ